MTTTCCAISNFNKPLDGAGICHGLVSRHNLKQKTDLAHGAQVGLVIGGGCGALVGAAMVFIPMAGQTTLPLAAIPIGLLGGAVFGAYASSLIASSTPNSRLKMFGKDFDEGHILMMVDVPDGQVDAIRELVASSLSDLTKKPSTFRLVTRAMNLHIAV